MNAMHLQAMDIIPQIPDAMMGDVLDYLSAAKTTAEKYNEPPTTPEEEIDLSGLPKSVNADKMTDEELVALFRKAEEDLLAGKGIPLEQVVAEFQEKYGI